MANWLRLVCHTIGKFCPGIDAQIKPAWIERRRFKQLPRKIVRGNAAVRREAEICSEECEKCDGHRDPSTKFRIAEHMF